MKTKRVLAGVVGAAMALTMAGAAFAFADTTYLHQTGTAIQAGDFAGDCDAPFTVGANEVGWHFILNQTNDSSANGHFAFSDGVVEQASTVQGNNLSWWVKTDAGVTLDGSMTYTDGTTTGEFNLSHTCVGATETATPTLPNETATPTLPNESATPTLPQTNTIGQTPSNGSGTSLTIVFALILAVAGGLVAYAMRPRRVGNR